MVDKQAGQSRFSYERSFFCLTKFLFFWGSFSWSFSTTEQCSRLKDSEELFHYIFFPILSICPTQLCSQITVKCYWSKFWENFLWSIQMSIGRSFPLKLCLSLTRSMSTQRPTYVMFLHVGRVFFLLFQFVLYFPLARVCPSFGTLTPGNNAPPIQGVSLTLVFCVW